MNNDWRSRIRLTAARCVVPVMLLYAAAVSAETGFSGGVTTVYQDANRGLVDAEWTVSADLVFTKSTTNGEWLIYVEGSTSPDTNGVSSLYPTANADAGSVINKDGDGGVQVSEFNYRFILSQNRSISVGLVNPSAWLDGSGVAGNENTQFINGSLKQNATIEFPDYSIGVVFLSKKSDMGPSLTVVVSGSDGIADTPDRSYQDLLKLTSPERGVFIGAASIWDRGNWSYGFGGWWRSDDHRVLGTNDRFAGHNYGAFATADWIGAGQRLNFRLGSANERTSIANRFLSAAYERHLGNVVLGAGAAHTVVANEFRQRDLEDVADAEVYVRIPIAKNRGHITPSVQYVENPGFDGSGTATPSSAVVAGVRLHWAF